MFLYDPSAVPSPEVVFSGSFFPAYRHRGMDEGFGGALTIYFALTFAIMVTLITACIYSAKVEAGRTRTANAADQAVFSLFSNYDQSLFDQYQIFMIDGSCGTDHLSVLTICNTLSENAGYILQPKKGHLLSAGSSLLSLRQTGCSITGYTLATDLSGLPFRAQAVQAEKDTLGLSERGAGADNSSSGAADTGLQDGHSYAHASDTSISSEEAGRSFTDYPVPDQSSEDAGSHAAEAVPEISVPADFVNPLPILEALRQKSLLPLVIDESRHPVSAAFVASYSSLISQRNLEKGFGMIDTYGASLSASEKLLFQRYLMRHFFCFTDSFAGSTGDPDVTKRSGGYSGLLYELEYLIAGKETDEQNLRTVARKLLLQREGINLACLKSDPRKHSEISQGSLLIAASIGFPELEPAIEELLSLAWVFAESLVDLYALFDGKHIAALKSATTWQTELPDLPKLVDGIAPFAKDVSGGLSYRDCLKALLAQKLLSEKGTERTTLRAMDLIEENIHAQGREHFRLDRCFDSLSFELSVTSERNVPLTAEASFSYRADQ